MISLRSSSFRVAATAVFFLCASTFVVANGNDTKPVAAESANAPTIEFREFFHMPIGPHGLKPTQKLLSLDGKRVHLVGYQVKEEEPQAGLFMLTPMPVSLAEVEDGPADDLPATVVYVHMPVADAEKTIAYRDGAWSLTGTLQVGNREEKNGRISYVRLLVEQPDTRSASR